MWACSRLSLGVDLCKSPGLTPAPVQWLCQLQALWPCSRQEQEGGGKRAHPAAPVLFLSGKQMLSQKPLLLSQTLLRTHGHCPVTWLALGTGETGRQALSMYSLPGRDRQGERVGMNVEQAEPHDRWALQWGWLGAQDQRSFSSGWSFPHCGIPQSFARVPAPSRGREPGISLGLLTLNKVPHPCKMPPPRVKR